MKDEGWGMNRKLALLFGLLLGGESSLAVAANSHNYISVGLGITQTSHSQDLQLLTAPAPGLTHRYVSSSTSHLTSSLSIGREGLFKEVGSDGELWFGAEGLYIRSDGASGSVHRFINVGPNFARLNFSYDIDSYLLLAKGKYKKAQLFKDWGGYVDAGIGIGITRLSNYQERIPLGSTAAPMSSPFGAKTKSNLTFSIGVGVTHKVGYHSEVSLGYRYINSGKGSLDTTPIQSTSARLQSGVLGHHLLTMTIRT